MKKITLGVFVFSVIALLGIGMVAAFPFGFGKGVMAQNLTEDEQIEMQAFHDSLQDAIENEDFELWKSLMESQITEENFEKILEQRDSIEERRSEREAYCEENDCPKFNGEFEGRGNPEMGHGRGMMMHKPFAEDSE